MPLLALPHPLPSMKAFVMISASLSPWTCFRCLQQQQRRHTRRLYASVAALARTTYSPFVSASIQHDDTVLRAVFDDPSFWRSFSDGSETNSRAKNAGLFGNSHLRDPSGFENWAYATLQKCRNIVTKVLATDTIEGYKELVKDLDRLSDLLCRIIDLADFVRSTHPQSSFSDAAARAHAIMFEYMNQLNTTTGLYQQLTKAMALPEVIAAWTEEELRVAEILKKDFEQSAIQLSPKARARFVALSSQISELGASFVDQMRPAQRSIDLSSHTLQGLDDTFIRRFGAGLGRVSVPSIGAAANTILRYAQKENVRRKVYIASRTSAQEPILILEELLILRSELARLSGFSSYGQMTLENKMAKSPLLVAQFLNSLSAAKSPQMRQILLDISRRKEARPQAWDLDYFTNKQARRAMNTNLPDDICAYFSLGTVIQGLSRLFHRLYGVYLVPREVKPGETWTADVRRLDVVSEQEGLIAVMYCDLFARVGKSPNPAHFTIRCSRNIPKSEIAELTAAANNAGGSDLSILANDGMAIKRTPDGRLFQLPTIALICDFSPSSYNSFAPPLLSPSSLSTLFHEMGHAIHSILGRTNMQNVSGTRCATDFAELPSVLMEKFATDPAVLGLYARHYQTDAPLPLESAVALQAHLTAGETVPETESQIMLARIDQVLHGENVGGSRGWSNQLVQEVYRQCWPVEESGGTCAQGFFGHLVGYGSTYYAYLFDRAIAGKVWEQVFNSGREGGAIDRASGEQFASKVLRWGGSRNPWACVGELIGGPEEEVLGSGGERAMKMVGMWGVDRA